MTAALLLIVVNVVGVAGTGPADAVLVGAGGEVLARGDQGWIRRGGGVAATLARAWGPAAGDIWAVGARPPLYHHDGRAWFAVPGGAAGPTVLAEPGSPVPAIAVGRRIYLVEARRLAPGPAAPGPVAALWVASARELIAVVDGKVERFAGGGWKPVAGASEAIVALGPRLALGLDGGVYVVEGRLRKLPGIEGFRPRLVVQGASPPAGRSPTGPPAGRRTVLVGMLGDGWAAAALDGGKLVLLGPLPGVARADEPVGLLVSPTLVVATRGGQVLVGDGTTWTAERVDLAAPGEAARPGPGPATIGR